MNPTKPVLLIFFRHTYTEWRKSPPIIIVCTHHHHHISDVKLVRKKDENRKCYIVATFGLTTRKWNLFATFIPHRSILLSLFSHTYFPLFSTKVFFIFPSEWSSERVVHYNYSFGIVTLLQHTHITETNHRFHRIIVHTLFCQLIESRRI